LNSSEISNNKKEVEEFKIKIFEPSLTNLELYNDKLINLYFYIITFGKVKIYYIEHEKQIVHKSYCMNKNYKFTFMTKMDIHIGPCKTEEKYRGKGIYPCVIYNILKNEGFENAYMIIDSENYSSQNGVIKVGFKKINKLLYNSIIKQYRVAK